MLIPGSSHANLQMPRQLQLKSEDVYLSSYSKIFGESPAINCRSNWASVYEAEIIFVGPIKLLLIVTGDSLMAKY